MRQALLALLLLLLSALPARAAAAEGELLRLPGPDGSELLTRLCRPDSPDPAPLLLLNHGAQPRAELRAALEPFPCDAEPIRWFLARGFAVAAPLRRGYGGSSGAFVESFGPCEDPDYLRVGRETARDIRAALAALLGSPGILPDGAVVLGESAGGWGSIALAAEGVPGVVGIINVAGGRGGWAGGRARNNCAPDRLVEAMSEFGRTARLPMLWLYAANDSYFWPALAAQLFDRFVAEGGIAEMAMFRAVPGDGHYFFFAEGASALWGPRVELFLASLMPARTAAR
ncbi:MAG: dienelactone hydrolase [Rhodovarius sp.]|nr:dienelactone hydrolase [Rhodovarius sp.]